VGFTRTKRKREGGSLWPMPNYWSEQVGCRGEPRGRYLKKGRRGCDKGGERSEQQTMLGKVRTIVSSEKNNTTKNEVEKNEKKIQGAPK